MDHMTTAATSSDDVVRILRDKSPRGLDLTRPLRTRDGRVARVVCVDRKAFDGATLVVLVKDQDDNETAYCYRPDGTTPHGHETGYLVEVAPVHLGIGGVYRCFDDRRFAVIGERTRDGSWPARRIDDESGLLYWFNAEGISKVDSVRLVETLLAPRSK